MPFAKPGFHANGSLGPLKHEGLLVQVIVRDNNVDQALKVLKKKMQREGIFREMKLRGHFEKPSEKKAREKAEAVRRTRKLVMLQAHIIPFIPLAAVFLARGFGARG